MVKKISEQSIFSEYKKSEDKVTAALLQVLHYGGHNIVCSLFEDIDLPSNEINVSPQVVEDESRPDGVVSCDCKYKIFIESKIFSDAFLFMEKNNWRLIKNSLVPMMLNGLYILLLMKENLKNLKQLQR